MRTTLGILLASILLSGSISKPKLDHTVGAINVTSKVVVGDSLKVKFTWTQPTDGYGNVDSTMIRLKLSKPWKFYSDTIVRVANVPIKRKRTTQLSDSIKLALNVADSVIFTADSVFQCRKGVCSNPGSAAFLYRRAVPAPAAMTIQVVTDSF